MYARQIPTSLFHALHRTRFTSALGVMSTLVVAACAVDSPSGLHAPAPSRSFTASSATTLGSASRFAVLGASTVTCTGAGTNAGDVGVSPGSSMTGFNPDCTLTGTLHAADDASASAQADAATAYGRLSAKPWRPLLPVIRSGIRRNTHAQWARTFHLQSLEHVHYLRRLVGNSHRWGHV